MRGTTHYSCIGRSDPMDSTGTLHVTFVRDNVSVGAALQGLFRCAMSQCNSLPWQQSCSSLHDASESCTNSKALSRLTCTLHVALRWRARWAP